MTSSFPARTEADAFCERVRCAQRAPFETTRLCTTAAGCRKTRQLFDHSVCAEAVEPPSRMGIGVGVLGVWRLERLQRGAASDHALEITTPADGAR